MSDTGHPGIKKMSPLGQAIFSFHFAVKHWEETSADSDDHSEKWKEVHSANNHLLRVWRDVRRSALDFPVHLPHSFLEEFGEELTEWSTALMLTGVKFNKPLPTDASIEQWIAETNKRTQRDAVLHETTGVLIRKAWAIEDRLNHAVASVTGRSGGRTGDKPTDHFAEAEILLSQLNELEQYLHMIQDEYYHRRFHPPSRYFGDRALSTLNEAGDMVDELGFLEEYEELKSRHAHFFKSHTGILNFASARGAGALRRKKCCGAWLLLTREYRRSVQIIKARIQEYVGTFKINLERATSGADADGHNGPSKRANASEIPQRALLANAIYCEGHRILEDAIPKPTDEQVYHAYREQLSDANEIKKLPTVEAFRRNIGTYRQLTGTQKRKRRVGSAKLSKNVVDLSEI